MLEILLSHVFVQHRYFVDPHEDAESQVWVLLSRVSQPWRKSTQIVLLEEHSKYCFPSEE